MMTLGRVACVVMMAAGWAQAQTAWSVRGGGVAIRVSSAGELTGVQLGDTWREVRGGMRLADCRVDGDAVVSAGDNGAIQINRTFVGAGPEQRCTVIERFRPTDSSVRWEVEVLGVAGAWSTAIQTTLEWPDAANARFWTAWGEEDPLALRAFADMHFWYGSPRMRYEDPKLFFCPGQRDVYAIPLASILESGRDVGLSIALSPEDAMLDQDMQVTGKGEVTISRWRHRISEETPVRFAMDLVAHEADWRGGLRWMSGRYPQYFNPVNARVADMAGTGAYSSHEVAFDAAKMKKMAFRVNWKASFDFPYMGMFLPPVADDKTQWTRYGGGPTSIEQMERYARDMRRQGFYVLSYFNVTEFGANMTWPPPARKTVNDADLWREANDYAYGRLGDAVWRVPEKLKYEGSRPQAAQFTWGNGIIMDCGEPAYRDFLLEQGRRHIEKIPSADGICIDRTDWLRCYNERRDDGISYFDGRPVRSLLAGWKALLDKLGPQMHGADKVIFINPHVARLDMQRHVDGIFSEFGAPGIMNNVGLLCINKPALGWTSNGGDLKPDPDRYFQRFLYVGAYPMAPFPGNDHSIGPDEWAERYYLDYGPMLDAMRGKKWVLQPHAVEVLDNVAKVNCFTVPGGWVLPVVLGGNQQKATVILRNIPGLTDARASATAPTAAPGARTFDALHPGSDAPAKVEARIEGGTLRLEVPLVRGCAMVRIRR